MYRRTDHLVLDLDTILSIDRMTSESYKPPSSSTSDLTRRQSFLPPGEEWEVSLPFRVKEANKEETIPYTRRKNTTMGLAKLRPFKGLRDGKENPEEFLEDLGWMYTQDYESSEPKDETAGAAYRSKTHRILFRNYLEDKASTWYADLDISHKSDWELLSGEFRRYYRLTPKDSQARTFELKVQLHNLEQKEKENIADYLDRAEGLATKLPSDSIDAGMATLKGMTNNAKKERVSFECNKDSDYSFGTVKKLIKAAYSEVGKTSPFDTDFKKSMNVSLGESLSTTTDDLLKQVLINTTNAFPALLQGMRSLNTAISSGNPPQAASSDGQNPSRPYRPRPDLSEIKCYVCGEMGHYASVHREQPGPPSQQRPITIASKSALSSVQEEPPVASKLLMVEEEFSSDEEHEYPAMAAKPPTSMPKTVPTPVVSQGGIRKSTRKGSGVNRRRVVEVNDDDLLEEEEEAAEEMDTLEESSTVRRPETPNTFTSHDQENGLPRTKLSKTGKVQELVTPKGPKGTDSIRGMAHRSRFDIGKILDLPLEITVGEFLDKSDVTIKELAYSMQRSTPRYRVRRQKAPVPAQNKSVTMANSALPPPITANAYEDDGLSRPLMVEAWTTDLRLPKTLLDGGSLVELFNRKSLRKMKIKPFIYTDGRLKISLANDTLTTLNEYVSLPVNIQGVVASIKAWLVDVDVYDLLLGVAWMRRVHCNQLFGEGKITIMGDDMRTREVPAQLSPLDIGLPTVEFEDDEGWSADDACQQLIDAQEKVRL